MENCAETLNQINSISKITPKVLILAIWHINADNEIVMKYCTVSLNQLKSMPKITKNCRIMMKRVEQICTRKSWDKKVVLVIIKEPTNKCPNV